MARAPAVAAAALAAALLVFAACAGAAPDCVSIPGCTACEEVGDAASDQQGSLAAAGGLDGAQAGRRLLKRGGNRLWAPDTQDSGKKPRGLLAASPDGLPSVDATDTGRHLLGRRRGSGSNEADTQDGGKTGRHLLGHGRNRWEADTQDAGKKPRGLLEASADGLPSVDAAATGRHLLGRPRGPGRGGKDGGRPRGLLEAYTSAVVAPSRVVCTACGTPGYQLDAAAGICGECGAAK